MQRRVFHHSDDDGEDETYNEAGPDSPSSWEDSKITKPSSKKSRRNVEKRVVSVPIADVEGSKNRGEVYPPSDSWAWRKYGQKPIKGSPYPRAYYRCSSSKGCPARKQVERSRMDPTKLIITYACDHNHPLPAVNKTHHQRNDVVVVKTPKKMDDDTVAAATVVLGEPPVGLDLSHVDSPMLLISGYCEPEEFGWFYDMALSEGNLLADARTLERGLSIGEEDDSLFGDLGDLPDCTAMFRHGTMVVDE